jgi:hypothetical protein
MRMAVVYNKPSKPIPDPDLSTYVKAKKEEKP